MAKYIQVGVSAARDPVTKEFLPAVPLYIEKTADAEQSEAELIKALGMLFGHRIGEYIGNGGLIGNAELEERRMQDEQKRERDALDAENGEGTGNESIGNSKGTRKKPRKQNSNL